MAGTIDQFFSSGGADAPAGTTVGNAFGSPIPISWDGNPERYMEPIVSQSAAAFPTTSPSVNTSTDAGGRSLWRLNQTTAITGAFTTRYEINNPGWIIGFEVRSTWLGSDTEWRITIDGTAYTFRKVISNPYSYVMGCVLQTGGVNDPVYYLKPHDLILSGSMNDTDKQRAIACLHLGAIKFNSLKLEARMLNGSGTNHQEFLDYVLDSEL